MDFENYGLKMINEEHVIYFYTNSTRIPAKIKSTSKLNHNCNFDGIVTYKDKYLGIVEFKNFYKRYDDFALFPLQLCKIHLPKLDVPFMLIIKCRCGTVLMYRFKKSHLKKFEVSEVFGFRHGEEESDELFFLIPKSNFKILEKDGTRFLEKFYINDDCHKPIIDEYIMKKIPRIRASK